VFFLMGVFMVAGSYYAVTGGLAPWVIVSSVPVSLLVSLILLANEMRDYESDVRYGIGTLTVRIGYRAAVILYCCLLASAYGGALLLAPLGVIAHGWLVLLALPFAIPPFVFMPRPPRQRMPIIPFVMLHHLAFGALFCASYFIS